MDRYTHPLAFSLPLIRHEHCVDYMDHAVLTPNAVVECYGIADFCQSCFGSRYYDSLTGYSDECVVRGFAKQIRYSDNDVVAQYLP